MCVRDSILKEWWVRKRASAISSFGWAFADHLILLWLLLWWWGRREGWYHFRLRLAGVWMCLKHIRNWKGKIFKRAENRIFVQSNNIKVIKKLQHLYIATSWNRLLKYFFHEYYNLETIYNDIFIFISKL